ncbi:hypothetical protein ACPPVQ_17245 [Diaminobutyricibacter sp. McL0618]|uniref:hypothetical protein n=1 Tax=Leifsonia sp. McL0618 TaxID=3415677 RepID=UPI003CFA03BD
MSLSGNGPVAFELEARPSEYTFSVVADGVRRHLATGSARLLSAEAAEWFVAAQFALLCEGPVDDAEAIFDEVAWDELEPGPPQIVLPF